MRFKHGVHNALTRYVDGSGVCPVCCTAFSTRTRLLSHVAERRLRGRATPTRGMILATGAIPRLDPTTSPTRARRAAIPSSCPAGRRRRRSADLWGRGCRSGLSGRRCLRPALPVGGVAALRPRGGVAADGVEDHEGVHAHGVRQLQEQPLPVLPLDAGDAAVVLAGVDPEEAVHIGHPHAGLQNRVHRHEVDHLLPPAEAHDLGLPHHVGLEDVPHLLGDAVAAQRLLAGPREVLHDALHLGALKDLDAAVLPQDLPGDGAEAQAHAGGRRLDDRDERLRQAQLRRAGLGLQHGRGDLVRGEDLAALGVEERRQQRVSELRQRRRGPQGGAEGPQGFLLRQLLLQRVQSCHGPLLAPGALHRLGRLALALPQQRDGPRELDRPAELQRRLRSGPGHRGGRSRVGSLARLGRVHVGALGDVQRGGGCRRALRWQARRRQAEELRRAL
mmetsp:Transcript_15780/g.40697  ORF Transcript_15780/g.40697 Transcript_15780/m.40697 type:complete len:447 (+) Transcript_15780:64-1404(+)